MEIHTGDANTAARQIYQDTSRTFWLGGNDIQTEGNWVWESNEEEINLNVFWMNGKPTNSNADNCLAMTSGGMFDFGCTRDLRLVCEYI